MRGIKNHKLQLKDRIMAKTGGVCAACGKHLERQKVTIDHYVPKYHGGTDDERNLVAEDYYRFLGKRYCEMASEYRNELERPVS